MRESPWKPIDTIPKTGKSALIWAYPMDEPIVWHPEEGPSLEGFTHWMPMPDNPLCYPDEFEKRLLQKTARDLVTARLLAASLILLVAVLLTLFFLSRCSLSHP